MLLRENNPEKESIPSLCMADTTANSFVRNDSLAAALPPRKSLASEPRYDTGGKTTLGGTTATYHEVRRRSLRVLPTPCCLPCPSLPTGTGTGVPESQSVADINYACSRARSNPKVKSSLSHFHLDQIPSLLFYTLIPPQKGMFQALPTMVKMISL